MARLDGAVDLVCRQREEMTLALVVLVTMGLLLVFSALFVEPGQEAFAILVFDAVLLGASLLFFAGAYYYCVRREMDD